MRFKHRIFGGIAGICLSISSISIADTPASLPQDDVLTYLEQVIQWQREAVAIDPASDSARERIFHDTLQDNSVKALKSGFKFAQQQAAISVPTADAPPQEGDQPPEQTPRQRMTQRAADNDRQIASLQKSLSAPGITRAQRQAYQDNLKLALAKQELYRTVLANMTSASSSGSKDLAAKIAGLAREIPELRTESKADTAPVVANTVAPGTTTMSSTTTTTTTVTHSTASIFTLAGYLFDNIRKTRELNDFRMQTAQLETSSRNLIKALRIALDAISGAPSKDATIDQQITNFKQIGAQILPLADATMWIVTSKTTIDDWNTTLDKAFKSLLRQLAIQAAVLAITLMIPLAIGNVAKRAINRYVLDPKRKRQAHTARRILVSVAIVFILLLNFISDFSSFATFFGFMTAGLAVALQSVLLSLVGHFFFYGRYGVRQGDRVRVANVTGDIVQIGMMRFYLRELHTMEDGSLKPSGKIVAFPNSILFQPTAFYKFVDEVR